MSKPSIFSKDYDRKMRNRKRMQVITIVVLIIGIFVVLTRAYVLNWLKDNADKLSQSQKQYVNDSNIDKSKIKSDDTPKDTTNNEKQNQQPTENKSTIDVKLPDGKNVTVECIDDGETKKINSIVLKNGNKVNFDINKDADEAVMLDDKQNMYTIDATGKVKDITKDRYVSTKGSVIMKSSYLSSRPNFMWHSDPKFLSDTKVAYITQMPWFKTTQYVYTVDTKTNNHVRIPLVQGDKISFGKLTQKGLELSVDGSKKYINAQGNLVSK